MENIAGIIKHAKQLLPLRTAVIHSVTNESLQGAVEAAQEKLIEPVLIGPIAKINKAAQELQIDLANYEIINTEHSHAAAEQAVALARAGKVNMLMKGSLHTDEMMQAVIDKEKGLRTDRRMSHAFVIETTLYNKLLLLTDCAINIAPGLMEKKDIIQNVIDLALAIGIEIPKVAILSAIETVTDKIPSTIDAAALCKMADRQQIQNGILDGPLAFDNAVSVTAAKIKSINSPVAGEADILIVPNLEAGNMLAKQLGYLAQAKLAGIVLGARIPIVLTSRADPPEARLASCALGVLYGDYLQRRLCSKLYSS
jgi:phosphate acetyltransferase/phosphate butyryltransferase